MVYIMNDERPINQSNCYYYSIILEGYKTAGFDIGDLKSVVDELYDT